MMLIKSKKKIKDEITFDVTVCICAGGVTSVWTKNYYMRYEEKYLKRKKKKRSTIKELHDSRGFNQRCRELLVRDPFVYGGNVCDVILPEKCNKLL